MDFPACCRVLNIKSRLVPILLLSLDYNIQIVLSMNEWMYNGRFIVKLSVLLFL